MLLQLNKNEQAIENYKKAVELNPNEAVNYNNLGNAYRKIGLLQKAEELLNKAINLNPNLADAYSNLGHVTYDMKDIEKSIYNYIKAFKLDENIDYLLGAYLFSNARICNWDVEIV